MWASLLANWIKSQFRRTRRKSSPWFFRWLVSSRPRNVYCYFILFFKSITRSVDFELGFPSSPCASGPCLTGDWQHGRVRGLAGSVAYSAGVVSAVTRGHVIDSKNAWKRSEIANMDAIADDGAPVLAPGDVNRPVSLTGRAHHLRAHPRHDTILEIKGRYPRWDWNINFFSIKLVRNSKCGCDTNQSGPDSPRADFLGTHLGLTWHNPDLCLCFFFVSSNRNPSKGFQKKKKEQVSTYESAKEFKEAKMGQKKLSSEPILEQRFWIKV